MCNLWCLVLPAAMGWCGLHVQMRILHSQHILPAHSQHALQVEAVLCAWLQIMMLVLCHSHDSGAYADNESMQLWGLREDGKVWSSKGTSVVENSNRYSQEAVSAPHYTDEMSQACLSIWVTRFNQNKAQARRGERKLGSDNLRLCHTVSMSPYLHEA